MKPLWPMGLLGLTALPLGWILGIFAFAFELAVATQDWGGSSGWDWVAYIVLVLAILAWGLGWWTYLRRVRLDGPVLYVTKVGLPVALVFIALQSYLSAANTFDMF